MQWMLTPFERGFLAHLVADWLLQNDWMARNKFNLGHPATWVHALIHALFLGLALGWLGGVVLALVHILIDTRAPMNWWRDVFRQTDAGPYAAITAVWADQVLHLVAIALWVILARSLEVPSLVSVLESLPVALGIWR
jgi:hypothetical protein